MAWRRAYQDLKVLGRDYGAILVALTPLDIAYDLVSLIAGRDLLSGRRLTNFETAAILLGFFTAGLGDDILRAWANQSAPLARFLSRGHRGIGCGFVGLVNRAWDVADYLDYVAYDPGYALSQLGRQAGANLRQGMREMRDPNQWRRAGQEFGQWWHHYGGMVVGALPIVGSAAVG